MRFVLAMFVLLGSLFAVAEAKDRKEGQGMSASDAKARINDIIRKHPVVVFSKTYCPYCDKVKALFNNNNVPFKAVELDTMDEGADLQRALVAKTGQKTVPNVFIGGEHIGGSDDTHTQYDSGRLMPKLAKCGAVPDAKKNSEHDAGRQEL